VEGKNGTGLLWDCFVNWSLTLKELAKDPRRTEGDDESRSPD
jgi:hypothetical protein